MAELEERIAAWPRWYSAWFRVLRIGWALRSKAWWSGWLFWAQRGHTSATGAYVIMHWPRHISILLGHGTSGLEVYRKMEIND